VASARAKQVQRALAYVNRRLTTYPLRSRPTGQAQFNEYWALMERKLALLIEIEYPDARAYVKAQVRATRTGGVRRTFRGRGGRPGYIREWDILLKWVSGPLKGSFTPVEIKSKRELIRSIEGGFRSTKIETRFRPRTAIGRQLEVDLVTLPRADSLEILAEDAVTTRSSALDVETRRTNSTRATSYGVVPDIPLATGNGVQPRVSGTFNGVPEGISFRNRPPPKVAPRVVTEIKTASITTEVGAQRARPRAGIARTVAAGVRGFIAGIVVDILIGLILGWIQRESARREIEEKLEESDAELVRQMRDAHDKNRLDLTRSTALGSVVDLWFVIEVGFTYSFGEGAPSGVGQLDDVYVSGEEIEEGAYYGPEEPRLNKVVLVAQKPEQPEDNGLPPTLVRVGVPFQFWNPRPEDFVGYWDLEPFWSWEASSRFLDHFQVALTDSGLTMSHIGRQIVNQKTRLSMPGGRAPKSNAHAVSKPEYDRQAQTLRFSVIWKNPVLELYGDFVPTDYYFQQSGPGVFVGLIVAPPAFANDKLFTFTKVMFAVR
jgi:hypothetical protein